MTKQPYEIYADRVTQRAVESGGLVDVNFREAIIEAWMAGLRYSNTLINKVTTRPFEHCQGDRYGTSKEE